MAGKKSITKTTEEKIAIKEIAKTMKIRMKATYIGDVILITGKEYEVASDLANALLKNGECEKC